MRKGGNFIGSAVSLNPTTRRRSPPTLSLTPPPPLTVQRKSLVCGSQ